MKKLAIFNALFLFSLICFKLSNESLNQNAHAFKNTLAAKVRREFYPRSSPVKEEPPALLIENKIPLSSPSVPLESLESKEDPLSDISHQSPHDEDLLITSFPEAQEEETASTSVEWEPFYEDPKTPPPEISLEELIKHQMDPPQFEEENRLSQVETNLKNEEEILSSQIEDREPSSVEAKGPTFKNRTVPTADLSIPHPTKPILGPKKSVSSLENGGKVAQKKENENPFLTPQRIAISHTEGCGERERRFVTNYSLLEVLLAPETRQAKFLPMIDLRGYRFDDGVFAGSFGFVGRYIPNQKAFCEFLGINTYYDYRHDRKGYSQQTTVGLEIIGKRWEIRGNFYIPFGQHSDLWRCCESKCINGWFAYGFNAELGYWSIRSKNFLLYTGLGPYYVTACRCEERQRGVMLRIVPQYKDYCALNLKFSYDPIFRAIFQAEIIISIPIYQISVPERGPCGIVNRQIYQRVERRF